MRFLVLGLLLVNSLLSSLSALAQTDKIIYDCFPPMPELIGGGGNQAIMKAIYERLIYPPIALRSEFVGRVFVTFVVTPAGEVIQVAITKSLDADFDSAAANAVRQLPKFKPRPLQYGNIRYTAPISFQIGEASRADRKAARHRNSTR